MSDEVVARYVLIEKLRAVLGHEAERSHAIATLCRTVEQRDRAADLAAAFAMEHGFTCEQAWTALVVDENPGRELLPGETIPPSWWASAWDRQATRAEEEHG